MVKSPIGGPDLTKAAASQPPRASTPAGSPGAVRSAEVARPSEPPSAEPRSFVDRELTALVVDSDGVSRRFVELALTRHANFVVELAKDSAAALEILRTATVDLIICETTLRDMSGLQFHRMLADERRLKNIPFVFLSAEPRVTTKVLALEAGASDYLTKPCDATELAARASALVKRERRRRDALRNRSYTLAGDFSAISFADLAVMLEMGRRTGTLAIVTPRATGKLFFDEGRIVHALHGNLAGPDAFYRLVSAGTGRFEFTPGAREIDPAKATMHENVMALLMESARLLDEGFGEEPPSLMFPGRTPLKAQTIAPPNIRVMAGQPPSKALAAQFEQGIRDGFTLGDLRLYDLEALKGWTSTEAVGDRFHCVLIADLSVGVSSMLALAAAPTERWVLEALKGNPKAFGLTFFVRNERVLDILLLDIANPATFQNALLRVPCLAIVAPPSGDLLAAGTKGRAELDTLLATLAPTAIMAVGDSWIRSALQALPPVRSGVSSLKCVTGVLGEGRAELRSVLIDGIRLWASDRHDST